MLASTLNKLIIILLLLLLLSPASLIIPSRNEPLPTAALNPTSIPPAQPPTEIPGNILQAFPSSSKSSLPPVSQKVMKSLQNKEYVDLSSLLPTSLYDQVTHPHSFKLKFNPTEPGESVVAVSSPASNKLKLTMPQHGYKHGIFTLGV